MTGGGITSGVIDLAAGLRNLAPTTARERSQPCRPFNPPPFLRNVLLLDAAASGASAPAADRRRGPARGLLGLPVALMREAGLILVPFVAFVAWVGTRESNAPRRSLDDLAANAAVGGRQHRACW